MNGVPDFADMNILFDCSCFALLVVLRPPKTLATMSSLDLRKDVFNKKMSQSRFTRIPVPRIKYLTEDFSRSILRAVCSRCLSLLQSARPWDIRPRQHTRDGTFRPYRVRTYGEQRAPPDIERFCSSSSSSSSSISSSSSSSGGGSSSILINITALNDRSRLERNAPPPLTPPPQTPEVKFRYVPGICYHVIVYHNMSCYVVSCCSIV